MCRKMLRVNIIIPTFVPAVALNSPEVTCNYFSVNDLHQLEREALPTAWVCSELSECL